MIQRFAKIVATLGPSSKDANTIRKLVLAGMDVARLNFSHGSHADHGELIQSLRLVSNELQKPISILQDLQGPKMRIGEITPEGLQLVPGDLVVLTPPDEEPVGLVFSKSQILIPFDVPEFARNVAKGSRVLLDDGNLELEVTDIGINAVEAKVILGGRLSSHKGVNLPGSDLHIPGFTDKDRSDLEFGLQAGVDIVAISFVRTASDIEKVRDFICQKASPRSTIPIIAKLERPEAITNVEAILEAADGVMVARGDLGIETSPASVPIMQKMIIEAANRHGKIVITATQMLDSMIHNPRPTRAEASDVANAIFDGTDAVMLSGETANGLYPIESVRTMEAIILQAEQHFQQWGHCRTDPEETTQDDALSLTRAARELAHDRNVACIAVFTQTGRVARLMSKVRPQVPILAFTPEQETYRRLGILWGVKPYLVPFASSVETMLAHVENALISSTDLKPGQQVVLISGFPVGDAHPPNFALLHTIGQSL